MHPAERTQPSTRRVPPPDGSEAFKEALQAAVKKELEDVAKSLDEHAEKVIKLYSDIGLDGEREAAAFKKVATDIRNRIQFLR